VCCAVEVTDVSEKRSASVFSDDQIEQTRTKHNFSAWLLDKDRARMFGRHGGRLIPECAVSYSKSGTLQ
jgi:hypothetical protein